MRKTYKNSTLQSTQFYPILIEHVQSITLENKEEEIIFTTVLLIFTPQNKER